MVTFLHSLSIHSIPFVLNYSTVSPKTLPFSLIADQLSRITAPGLAMTMHGISLCSLISLN